MCSFERCSMTRGISFAVASPLSGAPAPRLASQSFATATMSRDKSLSDSDYLPAPEVIAAEIMEDLEAALVQFREILGVMKSQNNEVA